MLSVAKLSKKVLAQATLPRKVQHRALHQSRSALAGQMYQHQSKLPKIPVPELKDTLSRYLVAVEPLVSAEQLEKTKKVVAEFESNPAWGPYLQNQLQELDRLTATSYIEGFWDTMYLEIRDPIVTNVNPGFILAPNPHADQDPSKLASLLGTSTQIAKAATLLEASAKFIALVKSEQLPPDMDKTTPFDMSQYPKLFSSTRLPGYSRDVFQHLPHKNARHVVVLVRGQYYTVDILDAQGQALAASAIAAQLAAVAQNASHRGPSYYSLGALTGQDRYNWSLNYAHLASLGHNRATLDTIESSLFAVCLEESAPATLDEAGMTVLHGRECYNRYYDKSVQLLIFQDGRAGINFEHTGFDGHTVLSFVQSIQAYQADHASLANISTQTPSSVTHLNVTLDEKLRRAIDAATADFQSRAQGLDGSLMRWTDHGKKFITSHGFSPDAYVQLAFQLTHQRLYGKIVSTYESSNVKHYNRGRTECVRSATSDAKRFVESFDSTATADTKLTNMKVAINRHVDEMKKSKEGKLVDRHLQVLNWLSMQQLQRQAGYKRPTLFSDPSYGTHFASILSTSNCGSPALDHFSFGPVTGSGFGLGYMILDNQIPVAVTSFQGKAHQFADGLRKSLKDMQTFVKANVTSAAKKL